MCMGRLLRFDGRFPTARFAVFTARSLVPPLDDLSEHMHPLEVRESLPHEHPVLTSGCGHLE